MPRPSHSASAAALLVTLLSCAFAHPYPAGLSPLNSRDFGCHPIERDYPAQAKLRREQKRQLTSSGEGGPSGGASSSPQAAGYSCDASTCKLPNCQCASTSPPGGLAPTDVPQFITFTADDAVEVYTTTTVNTFLAQRKNPNGCTPRMTYFTSLNYTNYSMVTDWYVAGNEIADHTMTHVGDPPTSEIDGNIIALNAFSGIPLSEIIGFRAPFLNYTADTFQQLHDAGFTYDSSTSAATPANESGTDAYWPYTLDHGLANDCLNGVSGICQGKPVLPGLWEIPMYAIFDQRQQEGVHLMDPWLDDTNATNVLGWLQSTFLTHYNGNRQPFGLYSHPIHLALNYPGLSPPTAQVNMVNSFLDWAQQFQNVWIVSNVQMLAWLKNPVSVSNLGSVTELGCQTPDVTGNICNGMYPNEVGLLENCPFSDFPWTTCYGCPVVPPTPANPAPAQASSSQGLRYRLPNNCSTPFWDPVGNKCLCTSSTCAFTDQTRPIGPNGANLTGGGTGASASASATDGSIYTPFSSPAFGLKELALGGGWAGMAVAAAVGLLLLRKE